MKQRLTVLLLGALSIAISVLAIIGGVKLLAGCEKQDVGVVYLQDYDCAMKYSHAQEEIEAYTQLLHRIWVDKPSYVEDVLTETDEFCTLDSLGYNFDIFLFWSEQDSIDYISNMEYEEWASEILLNYITRAHCPVHEPDEIAPKAP